MKKSLLLVFALCAFHFSHAQKDSVYTSIDEALKNPELVFHLSLTYDNLSVIPDNIRDLKNLETLDLSVNQLTSLPEGIGNLSNLQVIYLGDNNIEELPESFVKLTKLREIHFGHIEFTRPRGLRGNPLKVIPDLNNCDSLEFISIIGCENLTISDLKILKQPNLVFEWTKNQAVNKAELRKFKRNSWRYLSVLRGGLAEGIKRLKIVRINSFLNQ